MGLAFCGALFLCATKLAKVLQRNCKNCTVYIETGEVTEAPGNEAVVSEESKAEVPEISGNPEISEVSETAEISSAKEEFESHFTEDEKLDFSKIPKIVRTEDGSISIENGDGSFDAENDPYFSASSIYGGKNVKVTIKDVHMSNKLEYGLTPADNDCVVPWWINGGYPWHNLL